MTDSIYSEYPEEFSAIAEEQEAHVIAALSEGSTALKVQLPSVLKDFQEAALAVLRVASSQPPGVYSAEFILDLLRTQLADEATIATRNAAVRVENAEKNAAGHWRDAVESARRRAAWSRVR